MLKKMILWLLAAVLLFLLGACGSSENQNVVNEEPSPGIGRNTHEDRQKEPDSVPWTPDPTVSEDTTETFLVPTGGTRPYAVMIDNGGSGCLPQGGLDSAQVIYEAIVEGGYSRLMAVYWGVKPELIGPVRSARHYFIDYALEHDAVYVHYGWSPQAQSDIKKLKLNNINGVANSGGIFNDLSENKKNWQDSYTSGEKIIAYSGKSGYRAGSDKEVVFSYAESEFDLKEGMQAEQIHIKYSNAYHCGFVYDKASKKYLRERMGVPQVERATDKQLTTVNIIIQLVKNRTIQGDTEGRQELDNIGSGKGWFITGGKAMEITWTKSSRTSATVYTDANNNKIKLNPGQTWIQIVPLSGKVTVE